jgi:hypothetical protein
MGIFDPAVCLIVGDWWGEKYNVELHDLHQSPEFARVMKLHKKRS